MATINNTAATSADTDKTDYSKSAGKKRRTPKTSAHSTGPSRKPAAKQPRSNVAVASTAQPDGSTTARTTCVPKTRSTGSVLREGSKGAVVVDLLKRKQGATVAELTKATGWQAHSVRGFLSGALKKKHGIAVASDKDGNGERRYRIAS